MRSGEARGGRRRQGLVKESGDWQARGSRGRKKKGMGLFRSLVAGRQGAAGRKKKGMGPFSSLVAGR